MLEQSTLNGKVYYSQEAFEDGKSSLATRAVDISEVKFGVPTRIRIHRNIKTDKFLVELEHTTYLYDELGKLMQIIEPKDNPDDMIDEYNYGIANYHGDIQPYFIKNDPPVDLENEVDWNHFQMPPTLAGYPYRETFSYLPELVELLADKPATNVDRYKRPLSAKALLHHRFLPTSINTVETTFAQIAQFKRVFPIVALLNRSEEATQFAVLDLEPKATDYDRQLVAQYEAYYVEDTPRGGKHYLVKAEPDDHAFKYRLSDNLEVQVDTMITFYGINGQMLNPDPKPAHFDPDKEVGHKVHKLIDVDRPDEVSDEVQKLIEINRVLGRGSKNKIYRDYIADDDMSHADFVALVHLYRRDVQPYLKELKTEMLSWTLAEYAATIIPPRVKHNEVRLGVPYLVFLADEVIDSQQHNMKGTVY